jgi:inner membrane protein
MSDPTTYQPKPYQPHIKSRSADWGGKALLVCLLALLMTIPGLFVWALIKDRSDRSEGVVRAVSTQQGGAQQVLGPLLVVPWQVVEANKEVTTGWYVVSAETGSANVKVKTDTLRRGIFDVPVYHATADVAATFGPQQAPTGLPGGATVDWSQARLVVGFSDLRGAKDVKATLKTSAGETVLAFTPASDVSLGASAMGRSVSDSDAAAAMEAAVRESGDNGRFGLVSAPAAALLAVPDGGSLKATLVFTGAQRLSVVPFAKSTSVNIDGDWRAPSFDGGFLPEARDTAGSGFKASWRVPFVARGLVEQGPTSVLSLSDLGERDLGVTFKRTNNPYQNVMRALKYAVMFVGLVFLTFFVFEALSGSRLHPAQYVLIGLAQMTFYLLLLSLSEYIGFDLGFAIAAVATVALIGLYAGAAFKAKRYAVQALVIFSIVYGLIYLLMRLEDFALLAGSIAAFAGLSVAMWLTRNIDWYGGKAEVVASGSQQPQ